MTVFVVSLCSVYAYRQCFPQFSSTNDDGCWSSNTLGIVSVDLSIEHPCLGAGIVDGLIRPGGFLSISLYMFCVMCSVFYVVSKSESAE